MSDNLYILRVRLSWAKGVWREIAIPGDATLYELHKAILEAFEWADEDAHSFLMKNDPGDMNSVFLSESSIDTRHTHAAILDDFRLRKDDTFTYLYGHGERNNFPIKVVLLDEPDPRDTYPDVVDENGESPSQELAYYED